MHPITGIPPPLNVQAIQASPSDPVEVSWSPPSDGATTITGYRIFYGSDGNGSLPPVTTSVSLTLNANLIGQTVSLCTEAEQLTSQCTNTTVEDAGTAVTSKKQHYTVKINGLRVLFVDLTTASTNASCTCTMETSTEAEQLTNQCTNATVEDAGTVVDLTSKLLHSQKWLFVFFSQMLQQMQDVRALWKRALPLG